MVRCQEARPAAAGLAEEDIATAGNALREPCREREFPAAAAASEVVEHWQLRALRWRELRRHQGRRSESFPKRSTPAIRVRAAHLYSARLLVRLWSQDF